MDYKTGRAPSERFERGSLGGVQTYALLCESVLGRAPAEVRLLYLRQPVAISSVRVASRPSAASGERALAVWSAIERACDAEDFRPHVGPLCDYCHFKASCPAFAARERPPVSTIDEAVDAAFEPLRGRPGDRPGRRRRLQPGRLRVRLGGPGRRSRRAGAVRTAGAPSWPWPPPASPR